MKKKPLVLSSSSLMGVVGLLFLAMLYFKNDEDDFGRTKTK